jgi:ubiquitin-like modifier-activating enzyme ATG7
LRIIRHRQGKDSLIGVIERNKSDDVDADVDVVQDGQRPSVVGWEKNEQGKLGARMVDLAPLMDPLQCVPSLSSSSQLLIKLILTSR